MKGITSEGMKALRTHIREGSILTPSKFSVFYFAKRRCDRHSKLKNARKRIPPSKPSNCDQPAVVLSVTNNNTVNTLRLKEILNTLIGLLVRDRLWFSLRTVSLDTD